MFFNLWKDRHKISHLDLKLRQLGGMVISDKVWDYFNKINWSCSNFYGLGLHYCTNTRNLNVQINNRQLGVMIRNNGFNSNYQGT